MRIKFLHVHYIPKGLEPSVLYVSEEFGTAAHLCPCGCGSKVRTPLGKTAWTLTIKNNKPSLYPSIGNWQLPCQSHYWIRDGEVVWADKWTREQIEAGRHTEEERRRNYYATPHNKSQGFLQKIWNSLRNLFKNISN